jgi:hypothetical protein
MAGEDLDGVESNELDAETKAYFESGGEKLPAAATEQPVAATEKPVDAGLTDKAAQAAVEGDKQPTTVPLRALQEEREEKKALREEHRKASEELAILRDRWQTLLQMQQEQPKADADPEPDQNSDIFAHHAWLSRQLGNLKGTVAERQQQEQQARQAAEGERQVWDYWHQDAAAYKAKAPEFDDAVKWMAGERTKQLKALAGVNPNLRTEQGITAQINEELKGVIVAAAQARISPAEYIHNMAKEWGFKAKAAEPDPAKVIADANKGKDAEVSLSAMGGGAAPGPKSAEDVAAMSPADFEAWLTKNPKGFKRLFGG